MRFIEVKRPTLGPFMSVVCFRYLGEDAEGLAGRALVVDAGRQRGQDLVEELGIQNTPHTAEELQRDLDNALGVNGTRLCLIKSIKAIDGGGFEVYAGEYACGTYTLGVLIGAISAINGKTMLGKDTEAEGIESCERIYHITPL
jgi:hypothetical protein